MKKLICVCVLAALCLVMLAGCQCEHQFTDADCVTPKTCSECGETEGEALGHSWVEADCLTAKTCSVCKVTEGEALGHSWVDATCAAPKTCSGCGLTEGEALEHTWEEATTEAPKTCSGCGATEGERIITDTRFTTSACAPLFGTWQTRLEVSAADMGFSDGDEVIAYNVVMKFNNDGTVEQVETMEDPEAAVDMMINMMINIAYAEMEAQGYTREQADAEFMLAMGMTIEEFYRSYMESMGDLSEPNVYDMVYYVDGTQVYVGFDWDEVMTGLEFTLEDDTLTLITLEGEPEVYTRVAEAE